MNAGLASCICLKEGDYSRELAGMAASEPLTQGGVNRLRREGISHYRRQHMVYTELSCVGLARHVPSECRSVFVAVSTTRPSVYPLKALIGRDKTELVSAAERRWTPLLTAPGRVLCSVVVITRQ